MLKDTEHLLQIYCILSEKKNAKFGNLRSKDEQLTALFVPCVGIIKS